ncbi:hypothetical protein D3C81_242470 [compost metagenome]
MDKLLNSIHEELLEGLILESIDPEEPIKVREVPESWRLLGSGNYAAVLYHPEYEDYAVKIYAPGRPGIREEAEVYTRLGSHPAFSELMHDGGSFLVLRRLRGITFYDCIKRGVPIAEQAVRDIDEALRDAKARGLHPHDVHAKNVMQLDGRGLVVDISDFLKREDCMMWEDFKKAYYRLYRPLASRHAVPVPDAVLQAVRRGYRLWRKSQGRSR